MACWTARLCCDIWILRPWGCMSYECLPAAWHYLWAGPLIGANVLMFYKLIARTTCFVTVVRLRTHCGPFCWRLPPWPRHPVGLPAAYLCCRMLLPRHCLYFCLMLRVFCLSWNASLFVSHCSAQRFGHCFRFL